MSKKQKVVNWGNFPSIQATVLESKDLSKIKQYIVDSNTILARGNGRSYGDAAMNDVLFSTKSLNGIHSFNKEFGIIECDAGVTLDVILNEVVPHGFFLEVTPGTKFITIGGAIAADVHGKNHHHKGCFSQSLISFQLINQDGDILNCSEQENKSIYYATIGGMGLTGIIIRAKFKLLPIASSYIQTKTEVTKNLSDLMNLFHQYQSSPYSVAWIDSLASGSQIGRGVFQHGKHAEQQELPPSLKKNLFHFNPKTSITLTRYFPSFILSKYTIKLFNSLHFLKHRIGIKTKVIPIDKFFYPLDGISKWNRMYGKKGFIQYQCVLPIKNSDEGITEILNLVHKYKIPPFLTVLKLLGEANPNSPWSFPMKGFTLAMDFKFHQGIENLVHSLDHIVVKYEGRVYLAKDALSTSKAIKVPSHRTSKFNSIQLKRITS